jgi:predicted transposase YbfD/YdcC
MPIDINTSVIKMHGRLEERDCKVYDDLYQIKKEWKSVKSIIKIQSTTKTIKSGKIATEDRFYISSLSPYTTTAEELQEIIRSHWQIENSCHYVKDVSFKEDISRFRSNMAPQNMSILRSIAMNILRLNGYVNIKKARKVFGWGFKSVFDLKGVKR